MLQKTLVNQTVKKFPSDECIKKIERDRDRSSKDRELYNVVKDILSDKK